MKSVIVIFILIIIPFQVIGQSTDSLAADSVLLSNPKIFEDAPGSFESDETDDKPLTEVDVQAAFPGGPEDFLRFVSENFTYPPRCMEEGINGKVRLKFIVDTNGKISTISVVDSAASCPEFAEEAIRLLKKSPRWIPAQLNGEEVKSWREVPIELRVD